MKKYLNIVLLSLASISTSPAHAQHDEWKSLYADASSLQKKGMYTAALTVAQQSLKLAMDLDPEHPNVATNLVLIANIYEKQQQFAEADFITNMHWPSMKKCMGQIARMWHTFWALWA